MSRNVEAALAAVHRYERRTGRSAHALARTRARSNDGQASWTLDIPFEELPELDHALQAMRRCFERARTTTGLSRRALQGIVREVEVLLDEQRRARSDMVESNMRLVLMIAHDLCNRGLAFDDLVQEGTLGLLRAVDGFDPARGHRFSTYAVWWIRQAVARALMNKGPQIRIPVHMRATARRIQRAKAQLEQGGVTPTLAELAREAGVSRWSAKAAEELVQQPISLDSPSNEDSDAPLVERIAARPSPPSTAIAKIELRRAIESEVLRLPPREAAIVRLRYGLGGSSEGRPYRAVGQVLGLSGERVRQIERAAVARLRQSPWLQELGSR